MSVKYTIVERGNPRNPSEKKFYALAKSSGEITFKSLSQEIAGGSTTVSDTDVMAVLNELIKTLKKHLSEGKIVRLGDFGSFQISLSSEGAETAEKFSSSMIKSGKIQFRPGEELRKTLATLKYEKYK